MKKAAQTPKVTVREPRQARSRLKVELMLEATIRILEKEGMTGLTTNAVAAKAGISIGTVYQFFPNKETILDALAEREMAQLSARILAVMSNEAIVSAAERVAAVVRAVTTSYGRRSKAHRLVMVHSLTRGINRLTPLMAQLQEHLLSERSSGQFKKPVSVGDAFVIPYAILGVLRGMINEATAPPREEIERSLTRLIVNALG
jgi:AcrR family transcriptional regulator